LTGRAGAGAGDRVRIDFTRSPGSFKLAARHNAARPQSVVERINIMRVHENFYLLHCDNKVACVPPPSSSMRVLRYYVYTHLPFALEQLGLR